MNSLKKINSKLKLKLSEYLLEKDLQISIPSKEPITTETILDKMFALEMSSFQMDNNILNFIRFMGSLQF